MTVDESSTPLVRAWLRAIAAYSAIADKSADPLRRIELFQRLGGVLAETNVRRVQRLARIAEQYIATS